MLVAQVYESSFPFAGASDFLILRFPSLARQACIPEAISHTNRKRSEFESSLCRDARSHLAEPVSFMNEGTAETQRRRGGESNGWPESSKYQPDASARDRGTRKLLRRNACGYAAFPSTSTTRLRFGLVTGAAGLLRRLTRLLSASQRLRGLFSFLSFSTPTRPACFDCDCSATAVDSS